MIRKVLVLPRILLIRNQEMLQGIIFLGKTRGRTHEKGKKSTVKKSRLSGKSRLHPLSIATRPLEGRARRSCTKSA